MRSPPCPARRRFMGRSDGHSLRAMRAMRRPRSGCAGGVPRQPSDDATVQARALFDRSHQHGASGRLVASDPHVRGAPRLFAPHAVHDGRERRLLRARAGARTTRAQDAPARRSPRTPPTGARSSRIGSRPRRGPIWPSSKVGVARVVVTVTPEGASIRVRWTAAGTGRPAAGLRPVFWAGTRDIGPPARPWRLRQSELEVDAQERTSSWVSKEGFADQVTTRDFEPGSPVDLVVTIPALPTRGPAPPPSRRATIRAQRPRARAAHRCTSRCGHGGSRADDRSHRRRHRPGVQRQDLVRTLRRELRLHGRGRRRTWSAPTRRRTSRQAGFIASRRCGDPHGPCR